MKQLNKTLFAKLSLILLIFTADQSVLACSCEYAGNFLTVAPKSKLVALVRVTKFLSFKTMESKQIPMSMEVEIVDIYKGDESRKKVVIWGDNGILCQTNIRRLV